MSSKFLVRGGLKNPRGTKGGPMNRSAFTHNDREQDLQRGHAPKTMNDPAFSARPVGRSKGRPADLSQFNGQLRRGNPDTKAPGQTGPGSAKRVGSGTVKVQVGTYNLLA